jgi:predicted membrane protein
MARVTIGVCVGTCLAISGAFAATLLAAHGGFNPAIAQPTACYGLFLASCFYAFSRPIPRAAIELLTTTAALTLGVAGADLFANAKAWTGTWIPGMASVIGVDLTGMALGIVFACLARAAARRARHGDAHSVWALRATH